MEKFNLIWRIILVMAFIGGFLAYCSQKDEVNYDKIEEKDWDETMRHSGLLEDD